MTVPRVLVVDHRDSFVFNLVDGLARAGAAVHTVRGDLALDALRRWVDELAPQLVLLSPGPGHPRQAAATAVAWLCTAPAVPVLGVCLGHQAMALAAGAEVVPAPQPVHGRATALSLTAAGAADPLLRDLPQPLRAGRYHSLCVGGVESAFDVLATTADDGPPLVMAMRHRRRPWLGVQFHPESYLSPCGDLLLRRALAAAVRFRPSTASLP